MKGLIWNCRGIKKKGVSSFLQNLIREHRFQFIGLQETMQPNIDDQFLKYIDPLQSYLWKWTPSNGRSGGILIGINIDRFDVGGFSEGEYMLQMNLWDKKERSKWNLIVVYGAAQNVRKDSFLSELASFCSRNKDPFLIGGDFNIIRFPYEKNKPSAISRFTNTFNAIIAAYELIDVNMSGGRFTWSNNHSDPTLERLDKILISKNWEDIFPHVLINKMPREVSDHNPLIIHTDANPPLTHLSFKFELSWLLQL